MSKYIEGKIILVTGGADGIGFSIADKYLENGAKAAIVVDIDENKGKEAEETLNTKHGEGKAEFIKCDVTKDLEVAYNIIMDKYKYVDILVNNAGIGDSSVPRKVIEVNTTAVIEWSLIFYKLMKRGKGGTIINIASELGYKVAPYAHVYQASKFAVTGFTRSLGHKCLYSVSGVRTICLCPGLTDTNLAKKVILDISENKYASKGLKNGDIKIQDVDAVADAALEVIDRAPSGTMWSIIGGELKNVDVEIKFTV